MTTKQQLQDHSTRIGFLEKHFVQLESKVAYNQAKEKVKEKDVEFIGCADGSITLDELKATVKVLENYKAQGFKNIQL